MEQLEKSEPECNRLEKEKLALELQLKDAIDTAKERKSKLGNWKERSRALLQRVKSRMEKSQAECYRLEKEKMALEVQLQDAIDTAEKRKSKLGNWKERSRILIQRVKTRCIEESEAEITCLKYKIMTLETKLEAKVDIIQSLEEDLENARSNNANLTAQLEEMSRKGESLEAQLRDASATKQALQEALTVVQTDQKNELKNHLSQVLSYFEDCPNWAYKNLTREEREMQGTVSFHNSQLIAVEIANLWGCNEKEWDQWDPVTKQVAMNSQCVEEANELYWEHGFIPSPFKGKVGRRWNSLHIGTCDSVEGNLTDLNLRDFIEACESFVLNCDPSSKGEKGDLGLMYMERSGLLLPYDCWSLIAKIKKRMTKYNENSEENATLYEQFQKMNSYIDVGNSETSLVLKTVFREYVKVQQIDTVHDFSSDATNGILLDSSEIIAILAEEQPSRDLVPVKTAHLSYAAMNGRNFPVSTLDPFILMTETINHSAAKAIHKELYSREKVTAMLNKASETNLTNLQQLLSRLAIIRAQTMKSKKIMTARIRQLARCRARLRDLLRASLCNRQSNEKVYRKRKKEADESSETSLMREKKKRYTGESIQEKRMRPYDASEKKAFKKNYEALVEYKNKHGHCNVPRTYADNKKLGYWVNKQRTTYKNLQERSNAGGKDAKERIELLNDIGFTWKYLENQWMTNYEALVEYKNKHGHCNVSTTCADKKKLGKWVNNQRTIYKNLQERSNAGEKDAKERIELLNAIGFTWKYLENQWMTNYEALVEYKNKHGNCNVSTTCADNKKLGEWVQNQRTIYKNLQERSNAMGRYAKDRIELLNAIGFTWQL